MSGAAEALAVHAPRSAEPKFWRHGQREATLAEFCPISAPLTAHDAITRNGDYVRVWRVAGVSFDGVQPEAVAARHEALCNLLAHLPGDRCAVYQYRIQRRGHDRLRDPVAPAFSAEFSRRYQDAVGATPFLLKEFYLALLYRPFESERQRRLHRSTRSAASMREHEAHHRAQLEELGTLLEKTLADFDLRRLGVREEQEEGAVVRCWEAGELFSFLLNGTWTRVRMPSGPAWQVLPQCRLHFGGAEVELRSLHGRRYATMLDIKEFAAEVEPGTLSPLLYVDSEYVETQCLLPMSRRRSMAALELQQAQLRAADDAVLSQVEAIGQALNDVGDGRFAMGEYSYSLAIFGDSAAAARENARAAAAAVARLSALQLVPVDLIADAAWFSQLPGNFRWRTRKASISTRAFAALACCHTFALGKRDGNPWGEALAVMRTPAGHPFYLNLHASRAGDDALGKKLPGNTILVGQTGSGKTTLLTALLALTPKWPEPPRVVSFSLDRDTEIVIRALGGAFFRFEHGTPTGINPFQREPTAERLAHWGRLVQQCLRTPELPLLPSDLEAIDRAVRGLASLAAADRWMSTIRQQLPRNGENSLFNRLGRWCRGGELGWVFDQRPDALLDVRQHRALGFDYTSLLDSADVRVPLMLELLDIMGELIDGTPLIYHVAEAWKALGDPAFAEFVKYRQKTIRKMNGLGIFDTQQVEDLLSSANGRVMIEQSVTKIILPNQDAVRSDYVDGLGLTDAEFEVVRELGRSGARRFLIKQDGASSQCLFDLSGMDDLLAVLSTTLDNVELLDRIRAEVGDDPADWLPLFYARAQARLQRHRSAA